MRENFQAALAFVLEWESEYSNDPHDVGGETRWGISKKAHPDIDIKRLTREAASVIYHTDYWLPVRGDDLPSGIDLAVFDFAVNAGVRKSILTLQRVLGLTADGSIGSITLGTLAGADPAATLAEFTVKRILHYASLGTWNRYGKGWTRRTIACDRAASDLLVVPI